MKTIDLDKLEIALLLATTKFWLGKPPRFTLSRRDVASDGMGKIGIVLHARPEPITIIEVNERDFESRTDALVTRCAQKMVAAWTDWATNQLGEHDLKRVMSKVPYERIARSFPLVDYDLSDVFVD